MNLNEHHYRVLAALRAATVLRHEPGTLTPDGHHHMHTLESLATAGLLSFDAHAIAAAEGLRRNRLVVRRIIQSRAYFCIVSEAMVALAALEIEAGITEIVAAELDMAQAREDALQARDREAEAQGRLMRAVQAHPFARRPTPAEVILAGQEASR